jgi:NTE family protein
MTENSLNNFGIALSGGGARGIIHIGVLKALEESNLKPCCVAGTSIGAIVGAFYCSGVKPEKMLELISGKSFLRMFSIRPSFSGLLKMDYLEKILKEYVPENFEELNIPLYVCAANLSKHEVEVFHQGDVYTPIIASSSIPVLFEPVELKGNHYIDGGTIENLPSGVLRGKCDYILGVEVNRGKFTNNLNNIRSIAMEVFQLTVHNNTKAGMMASDGLIQPELDAKFKLLDFAKAPELFEIGYKEGMKWAKEYKKKEQEVAG